MPAWGWSAVNQAIAAAEARKQLEEAARRQQTVIDSILAQRRMQPSPATEMYVGPEKPLQLEGPRVYTGAPPVSASGVAAGRTVTSQAAPQVILDMRRPPLPYVQPTSPVQDLKRRAALRYSLTPEAQRDLYQTPASVYFTESPPPWSSAAGSNSVTIGQFNPRFRRFFTGDEPIQVWSRSPSEGESTMAHEYAHKRYYEDDPMASEDWIFTGMGNMTPSAKKNYGDYLNVAGLFPPQTWRESYATQAEFPQEMTPEMRERYYPGLWQQGAWR